MSDVILRIKELGFQWETKDPFLFCAFHEDQFPKGRTNLGPSKEDLKDRFLGNDFHKKDGWRMYHGQEIPGFPYHPHAGFETITLVEKGFADHSDSMGAKGRFGQGDAQWMTAGKGILHSEMFPLINQDKENPLLLFQIWLNLPKRSKKVEPHYKMLWHEDIPVIEEKDEHGNAISIKIIAGKYKSEKALDPTPDSLAAEDNTDIQIWRISLEAGAEFTLPPGEEESNRVLFFYEGDQIKTEGFEIPYGHSLDLKASQKLELVNGNKKAELLLLQGKPINEAVVQQGPFVANSTEDMNSIIREYQRTQFGGWPWPKAEFTHGNKGRFALFSDGNLIEKPK
jgi:redox-sensitive bicupin YhaK (pirin superfamily)